MATRAVADGSWTYDVFADLFADPAVCIITYCLPCVTYGQNAEIVHGPAGSCVNHGLKYYLYSCICLCGLVAGPTRKALRDTYKLPAAPPLGAEANTDCLVHTIPCTACFAMCQESNEIKARNITTPIAAQPFDWAPTKSTTTAAPAQQEMAKEAAPAPAPVAEPVPTSAPAPAP